MTKEVRIDKWLWATRVFKTRTIATDACKKGRVTIAGMNVKPSRPIKIGEIVCVKKPPITYSFLVKDIAENRMGAKLVPQYLENVTTSAQPVQPTQSSVPPCFGNYNELEAKCLICANSVECSTKKIN